MAVTELTAVHLSPDLSVQPLPSDLLNKFKLFQTAKEAMCKHPVRFCQQIKGSHSTGDYHTIYIISQWTGIATYQTFTSSNDAQTLISEIFDDAVVPHETEISS